jgi:hypothetical protein
MTEESQRMEDASRGGTVWGVAQLRLTTFWISAVAVVTCSPKTGRVRIGDAPTKEIPFSSAYFPSI